MHSLDITKASGLPSVRSLVNLRYQRNTQDTEPTDQAVLQSMSSIDQAQEIESGVEAYLRRISETLTCFFIGGIDSRPSFSLSHSWCSLLPSWLPFFAHYLGQISTRITDFFVYVLMVDRGKSLLQVLRGRPWLGNQVL